MSETLLEVEGLAVDIATGGGTLHAVRGVSFDVRRGETLCLVGESGCGKSMTALAIMDLLPRQARRRARRLRFAGRDLLGGAMERLRGDRVAMIFQEPMTALNPAYPIGDQLTEGYLRHKGGSAAAARERAVHLLGGAMERLRGDRVA
ncbi:MAG TPA: ATP-binding cassette domain-containing protein, partial [Beijerinckiaceae bacterium]